MKEYKAYIFDLDGTLLDTLEDLADAVNHSMRENGFPARTLEEVRSFVGDGMRLLVKRAAPDGTGDGLLDKAFGDFRDHYSVHYMDKTKPYPGIAPMLRILKAQGKRLCVISNKADFAVKLLMDQFFPGIFETVLGERDGIRRKPAPDSLLAVMEELGLPKEECVYIGDSDTDIETAKNAGTDSISVSWGFRTEDFLKDHGAMKIALSPWDIPDTGAKDPFMAEAVKEAFAGISQKHGGPFGCVIVKDGQIVGRGHNMVLENTDSTAHGEITAIRNAEKALGKYDLSGCELYTTGEPCPMCLYAILWAKVEKVYYGCTIEDNAELGFRDKEFDEMGGGRESFKDFLVCLDREACLELFRVYSKLRHDRC